MVVFREKSSKKAERRKKKRQFDQRVRLVRCRKCEKKHPHGKNHKCGTRRKQGPNNKTHIDDGDVTDIVRVVDE